MTQQLDTQQDETTRGDDRPGPGTLGAQRREREVTAGSTGPSAGGAVWRVLAVVAAIILAVAAGYLVGAGTEDAAGVVSNPAEANALRDEKDQLVAGTAVAEGAARVTDAGADGTAALQEEKELLAAGPALGADTLDAADDVATLQAEKEAIAAAPERTVTSTSDEAAALHGEKLALAASGADTGVTGGEPTGAQHEKELLIAR